MKNTKNVLITGVALAIALFASIQVTAMEPNKKINPKLNGDQQALIEETIRTTKDYIKKYCGSKDPRFC